MAMETRCGPGDEVKQAVVNVSQYRGDTFRIVIELGDLAQQPVDVASWEWMSQLRDATDAVVADIVIDETAAADGLIQLSLADDVTEALPVADYAFDLQATDETDETRTLLVGRLRLKADVSREG